MNNYRLLHWNKGSSNIENKINDIFMTIDNFKPDFMLILEAKISFDKPIKISRLYLLEKKTKIRVPL